MRHQNQRKHTSERLNHVGGGSRIHSLALHYEVMGATNALEMSVHLLASMLPVHKDYYY